MTSITGPQDVVRKMDLVSMCMRAVAKHMASLTTNHLVLLPEPRLRQLFRLLDPIMTYTQWQLLADAIYINTSRTNTPHGVKPFRWEDDVEPDELPRRIQTMQPHPGNVHFLTILKIKDTERFNTRDLLLLAELRSLVILHMEDHGIKTAAHSGFSCNKPSLNLNNHLIRGWSEKKEPFPSLRSLILFAMPGSLSIHMLHYATKFPKIKAVYVNSPMTNPPPVIGQPLKDAPAWAPVECYRYVYWDMDMALQYEELGLDNPYTSITLVTPSEPGQVNTNKGLLRNLCVWEFSRDWNVEVQAEEAPTVAVTQPKRKATTESAGVKPKKKSQKIGDLLSSFG
ncbi:uncharacterized protein QC763_508307 [Podospora pseudopauciseta]|uniref:Uncharacterized protein n=1 Tax=Podospora pseudopauciseta TaxID=2093780 RepID=A0ABR0H9W7_9PEZI|nr:hypothetical protein QC763_508307 [Podospora pseudopauciseta]